MCKKIHLDYGCDPVEMAHFRAGFGIRPDYLDLWISLFFALIK